MRYADLNKHNWAEIQECYDKSNLQVVIDKFKIGTTRLSAAVKQGYFKTRPRSISRRLSGKDRNPHTAETKEKIRLGMLRAVKDGRQKTPVPYGTKCKHIKYKNWKGEEMTLLGSWEERVAKYLDEHRISWTRPKNGIRYTYKNQEHYYFPDFYLTDLDVFVEVKGYETDRDREKWKQFPFKLVILNKDHIFNLSQFFNNIGQLAQRLEQRT